MFLIFKAVLHRMLSMTFSLRNRYKVTGNESLCVGVEMVTEGALITCSGNISSSWLDLLLKEMYVL